MYSKQPLPSHGLNIKIKNMHSYNYFQSMNAYLLGHNFTSGFLYHTERRYHMEGPESLAMASILNLEKLVPKLHSRGVGGGMEVNGSYGGSSLRGLSHPP